MTTLIFGGAGSLGTELTKYLLNNFKYEYVYIASRDEAKHWELKNKFQNDKLLQTYICDVRNKSRVKEIILTLKPNRIIIAQALKQVDTCEKFPEESIDTNILGVRNILDSIRELSLMKIYIPDEVCFVSTDKSCNPINVYGMCKSIAEKMVLNLSDFFEEQNINTKFIITRYGNVLSTKGSIIPLYMKQATDPNIDFFGVTHVDMTRFIMTLEESVELIFYALKNGENGELWVPKLPSMKIIDLAEIFSDLFGKKIKTIGIRPGEKVHEVMLNEEEYRNSTEENKYFVVKKQPKTTKVVCKEYSSKDTISKDELKEKIITFLKDNEYIK